MENFSDLVQGERFQI